MIGLCCKTKTSKAVACGPHLFYLWFDFYVFYSLDGMKPYKDEDQYRLLINN